MKRTNLLTEVALFISFAVVLEVVFTGLAAFFPILQMPYGGRVSLSMFPLIVITYRHGFKWGVISGSIYGILNLMFDGVLYHPASLFLDYLFAFGVIGIGYIGVLVAGKTKTGFVLTSIIAVFARFVFHFISGVVLFAAYTPDSFTSEYTYSLAYNAYYLVPSLALVIIVGVIFYNRFDQLELN
ncbi:MAG: energy-coupled thiamine transporter ThiT [Candidatus Izimaplasma sp.]|nr:energy-coupled thiamine transporter ThiT [Candidatus Izimaplasma bacterium]